MRYEEPGDSPIIDLSQFWPKNIPELSQQEKIFSQMQDTEPSSLRGMRSDRDIVQMDWWPLHTAIEYMKTSK